MGPGTGLLALGGRERHRRHRVPWRCGHRQDNATAVPTSHYTNRRTSMAERQPGRPTSKAQHGRHNDREAALVAVGKAHVNLRAMRHTHTAYLQGCLQGRSTTLPGGSEERGVQTPQLSVQARAPLCRPGRRLTRAPRPNLQGCRRHIAGSRSSPRRARLRRTLRAWTDQPCGHTNMCRACVARCSH